MDIQKEIKTYTGIIEYYQTTNFNGRYDSEISAYQTAVEFYKHVLTIESSLEQSRMIFQRQMDMIQKSDSGSEVNLKTEVKANQVWINADGIEYTISFNKKVKGEYTVSAYTFDLSVEKSNGRIEKQRCHWVTMNTEKFVKEFKKA